MTNPALQRSDGPDDDAPPANAAGAPAGEEAKPLPQATLHEMIDVCHDEALRIETMQEILVRGGSRQRPDPQMVRRMEIFQATVRFLDACDQHKRAVREALAGPVENRR
jgi:hypothetical protein